MRFVFIWHVMRMNWKTILIAAMNRKKYRSFIHDTEFPELARERLWQQEIFPLLKQSSYWPSKLQNNLNEFPITTYEDYEKELLTAQHNLIQPFNGEKLIFWSETSGTAGARKFFPITASFQKQFQRTMPPYIYSLTQRHPQLFKEKFCIWSLWMLIAIPQLASLRAGLVTLITAIYLLLLKDFMPCLMNCLIIWKTTNNGPLCMLWLLI